MVGLCVRVGPGCGSDRGAREDWCGTGAVEPRHRLQLAPASRVAPIDKLSLGLTIVLAAIVLGESISWKLAVGATLMLIGALLTLAA